MKHVDKYKIEQSLGSKDILQDNFYSKFTETSFEDYKEDIMQRSETNQITDFSEKTKAEEKEEESVKNKFKKIKLLTILKTPNKITEESIYTALEFGTCQDPTPLYTITKLLREEKEISSLSLSDKYRAYIAEKYNTTEKKLMEEFNEKYPVKYTPSIEETPKTKQHNKFVSISNKRVRNVLHALFSINVADYKRVRNQLKYFEGVWHFKEAGIKNILNKKKEQTITLLNSRIEKEQNTPYFECKNKCMRLPMDNTLEYGFQCPECKSLMQEEDKKQKEDIISKLKKDLSYLTS